MLQRKLMIIGSLDAGRPHEPVAASLDLWPIEERPALQICSASEALNQPGLLDDAAVAWVLLDGQSAGEHLYELIALLQDRQIAAILTRAGETLAIGDQVQDGVIAVPPSTSPQAICLTLRTLWAQAQVVVELQQEIHLLRLQHKGLCGQIHRLDEELRMASKLQAEFMPQKPPTIPGVRFGILFRPAGYVSGDIYDVIRLDEEHVGLLVVDAVGHGVPAALMTVSIKKSLCTKEIGPSLPGGYRIVPPSQTLARLNLDMIEHQAGKVRTATAWYGVINVRTGVLQYARAGHPLPLLLHADGGSSFLDSDGSLLAVFPEETYEERTVQLHPGDRLLLYSDGFECAFQEAAGLTAQRHGLSNTLYQDQFRAMAHGTLDQAMTRLVDKLDQQIGSLNQIDDLTVICMDLTDELVGTPPHQAHEPAAALAT
ncbi:MAG: SpoIIE family protein phosphatase [Phycisphaeraceae bacterium]